MRISTRSEYAAKALLFLALQGASNDSTHPAQIQTIAETCDIPVKYLEQILVALRNQGLLASRRGVAGGYYLLKTPDEITIGEVVKADGRPNKYWSKPAELRGAKPASRALQTLWAKVDAAISETLDKTTFADLRDEVRAYQSAEYAGNIMFYI